MLALALALAAQCVRASPAPVDCANTITLLCTDCTGPGAACCDAALNAAGCCETPSTCTCLGVGDVCGNGAPAPNFVPTGTCCTPLAGCATDDCCPIPPNAKFTCHA